MNEFKESLKVEIGNMKDIPVYPNTAEDVKKLYELHKQKRNGRVYKKFGKEYELPIKPASIDIKEQNEFHREIIEEMRY